MNLEFSNLEFPVKDSLDNIIEKINKSNLPNSYSYGIKTFDTSQVASSNGVKEISCLGQTRAWNLHSVTENYKINLLFLLKILFYDESKHQGTNQTTNKSFNGLLGRKFN